MACWIRYHRMVGTASRGPGAERISPRLRPRASPSPPKPSHELLMYTFEYQESHAVRQALPLDAVSVTRRGRQPIFQIRQVASLPMDGPAVRAAYPRDSFTPRGCDAWGRYTRPSSGRRPAGARDKPRSTSVQHRRSHTGHGSHPGECGIGQVSHSASHSREDAVR